MRQVGMWVGLLLLALHGSAATAGLVSAEDMNKEYAAKHPPSERLRAMKAFISSYSPFVGMGEEPQRSALLLAAHRVAEDSCTMPNSSGVAEVPRWVVEVADLYDFPVTEGLNGDDRAKNVLAWTVVGIMKSDPIPCDIAQAAFIDAGVLK